MQEQYFINPYLLSEKRKKELDPIVTEVAYKLDGLYGYEIEHVINTLRSQIFCLVKLNLPDEGRTKQA